jgi:hypothetical protein
MIGKGLILSVLGVGYGFGNVTFQAAMLKTSPADIRQQSAEEALSYLSIFRSGATPEYSCPT